MKEAWKRSKIMFVAILAAGAIVYCLFPVIRIVSSQLTECLSPVRVLTVEVLSVGESGGSEIWMTAPQGSQLLEKLREIPSHANYNGICEYRKAEEYGYAFDFLISFGDNLGSVFEIPYTPSVNAQLLLYCQGVGGVIELTEGDTSPVIIDTYSPTGEIKPFELKKSVWEYIVLISLSVIILVGCILGLYFVLLSEFWRKHYSLEENSIEASHRDASIDFARTVAAFGVVYVHAFLASAPGTVSYYNTPMAGPLMFVMTILRHLALCCVPLFMLLSGYLCVHRVLISKAWSGIIPMLVSYVLICCIHLIVQHFVWGVPISISYILNTFIGMDLAWYLEMYIGLALLQPFLNIMWMHLDRGKRDVLVLTMLALTTLGSISENLLPTYWVCLYPLTYYFVGAWLREYAQPCHRGPLFLGLIAMLCLEAIRSFGDAKGGVFAWQSFGGYACAYNSMPVVICTVILFLFITEIPVRSKFLKKFLHNAGKHTLSTYLVSVCVTDSIYWSIVLPHFPTVKEFFPVQFPAAVVLYLVALFIANAVEGVTRITREKAQSFLLGKVERKA